MLKNNDLLLIFALIVLICSMARYNGRLHCIVGVLLKIKGQPDGRTTSEHNIFASTVW